MDIFLIINPFSRSGKSSRLAKEAIEYLNNLQISFEYEYVNNFEDAFQLSKKANLEGYKKIIAVGGDGTINKVINGFYDKNGRRISDSKFGVIYTGTSPDFCKSYSISTDIINATEIIICDDSIEIPIARIEYKKELNGYETVAYFGCCANIGLGASLARKANSGIRKYLGDFLGTFISLLQILFTIKPNSYKIKQNDIKYISKNRINISIGLTKFIASGIKVPLDNESCNEKFYVLEAGKPRIKNLISFIKNIYSGRKFKNSEDLSLSYTEDIEIDYNEINNEIEFDGDPVGYLPCKITLTHEPLTLLKGKRK